MAIGTTTREEAEPDSEASTQTYEQQWQQAVLGPWPSTTLGPGGRFHGPVRFGVLITVLSLLVLTPAGLGVSTIATPPETTPIWRDWGAYAFPFFWILIGWAYAWQPIAIPQILTKARSLVGGPATTGDLAIRFMKCNIWRLIILFCLTAMGLLSAFVFPEPDFVTHMYFRAQFGYYVAWGTVLLLLWYGALVIAMRQCVAGVVVVNLARNHRPKRSSETIENAANITRVASALTSLIGPFVTFGIMLLGWAAFNFFYFDYRYDPFLLMGVVFFIPVLMLSLLAPLTALAVAMRRNRELEGKRIEDRISYLSKAGRINLADAHAISAANDEIRELELLWQNTQDRMPLMPVLGAPLRIVAAGAVAQVVGSTFGIAISVILSLTTDL